MHNLEKQDGVSETLAEIKAQVYADVADAKAIDDADAPASTDSQANIQIIINSSKGTDANKTSELALISLSEDQRARFDRAHALAKQESGCGHCSVSPPGPSGRT